MAKEGGNAFLSHYFSEWDRLIVFGLLPCCVGTIGEKPRKQQFLRRDAKIQVCPHEFSTESYLLPDASWKLIALFLVLPVVVSVIGVIAYVLINSYFSRISYWISRR